MKKNADTKFKLQPLEKNPLASFILITYNQEKYIYEAVMGALSQSYRPLEIIISDDNSTDRTFDIIKSATEYYKGPHSLKIRKNIKNIGLASHINLVMNEISGSVIVIAAGDDVSLWNRTEISVDYLKKNTDASAVILSANLINDKSEQTGPSFLCDQNVKYRLQEIQDLLRWRHITFGATRAIRREVFSIFGDLNEHCPTEDTPLLLRSLLIGKNIISNDIGILYRKHETNLGNPTSLTKMNSRAIYAQYIEDVRTWANTGYGTEDLRETVIRWSSIDEIARSIRLKIALGEPLSHSDYINMLSNKAMTLGEKIRLLIQPFIVKKMQ